MNELDQLKKLTSRYEFDTEDNRELIAQYEKTLREIEVKERLAEKPGFKEWIEYLTLQIQVAESQNATDRKQTPEQRQMNFTIIDLSRQFLTYFDTHSQKESLQKTINEDLDRAQGSL